MDRMNSSKETVLTWARKIGLSAMIAFEEIILDSYVHDKKIYWNSNLQSRSKIAQLISENEKGVSDTRIKQHLSTLLKHDLISRESKGLYRINERIANIIIEHPTKKGQ